MSEVKIISYEEFCEEYKPLLDTNNVDVRWYEIDELTDDDGTRVWTEKEGDNGTLHLSAGYGFVNRTGRYLLTEKHHDGRMIDVEYWTEEDEEDFVDDYFLHLFEGNDAFFALYDPLPFEVKQEIKNACEDSDLDAAELALELVSIASVTIIFTKE